MKSRLFFLMVFSVVSITSFSQNNDEPKDGTTVIVNDSAAIAKDSARVLKAKPFKIKTIARDDSVRLSRVSDSLWVLEISDSVYLLRLEDLSRKINLAKKEKPPDKPKVKWTRTGIFNINFANVGLSNWAAGGESAISLSSNLALGLVRETEASIWNNTIYVAYGISRFGGRELQFSKSDDAIQVTTQYSLKVNDKLSFSGKIDFSTQFAGGFKTITENDSTFQELISSFMSPGRVFISSGLQFKTQKDKFVVEGLFSPVSGKLIYVLDKRISPQDYGLSEGSSVLREIGMQFNGDLLLEFKNNISFQTSIRVFSGFEKVENLDINWTTNTIFKINKYLNANFNTHMIYDEDIAIKQINSDGVEEIIGPRIQFKHVLTLGIAIKL